MQELRQIWAWCFGERVECGVVFDELAAAYGQNKSAYHTIEHASEVVEALTALHVEIGSSPSPEEQLAAWCHDVIYEPGASDNEERSALVAVNAARALGWSDLSAARVHDLVLGTAHRARPSSAQALVADADLSALAKQWRHYVSDTERLRVEIGADDATWLRTRRRVIEGFLASPSIFTNRTAVAMWEQAARDNLERELMLVKASAAVSA